MGRRLRCRVPSRLVFWIFDVDAVVAEGLLRWTVLWLRLVSNVRELDVEGTAVVIDYALEHDDSFFVLARSDELREGKDGEAGFDGIFT